MKVKTNLGRILDGVEADKLKCNTAIIKLLSDKTILAWIMKYTIDVYNECTIEEIRECIEGVPEIHKVKDKKQVLRQEYDIDTSVELEDEKYV